MTAFAHSECINPLHRVHSIRAEDLRLSDPSQNGKSQIDLSLVFAALTSRCRMYCLALGMWCCFTRDISVLESKASAY